MMFSMALNWMPSASKLEALKASLEKRNTRKANGPTKAQKANAEMAEKIFEAMNPDEVYETKAIGGLVPDLAEASTQSLRRS